MTAARVAPLEVELSMSSTAGELRIETIEDDQADAWDAYVAADPHSSVYHEYSWRRVVRSVFGHQTFYLAAKESRQIAGVLPLVRLKSRLFGDFLVSLPYFNYGGVLARTPYVAKLLLEQAARLADCLGASHVELRHCSPGHEEWPARTDKVSMLLRLPPDIEALQKSLSSKLRSQIKRPLREGVECVFGREELLEQFYAVFAQNMRDLGTPVYPMRFFREIVTAMPQRTTVAVVRLRNAPVAAAVLVSHRNTMEIPWASSLREVNNLGVNMYMYWRCLELAVQRGLTVFDFGRSTLDSGTFRFKKQWGAEPLQLHWHYWLRNGGQPPQLNPANPRYRLAVAAWRRLPVSVANWLGPHVVRNLP